MLKTSQENVKKITNTEAAELKRLYEKYGIAYIFADGKFIGRELGN